MGPWGILIGPLLGAVGAELLVGSRFKQALRSGTGSMWGFVGGTLVKMAIVGIMIAWFLRRIWPDLSRCLPWI
jgi:uncharacterized protein YqgC (DUF456 family)